MRRVPFLAITMGDPAGIGPEVIAKALLDEDILGNCRVVIIGNTDSLNIALKSINAAISVLVTDSFTQILNQTNTINLLDPRNIDNSFVNPGQISSITGKASIEWVLKAGELANSKKIDGVVTAPINKEACRLAGYDDIGHMEIFQKQTRAKAVATMLVANNLRVVHLTTHKSLSTACTFVTLTNILEKIKLTDKSFKSWGFPHPRIAVSALNPHASDGGLIGTEEHDEIIPAILKAQSENIDVSGPIPADTVFNQAIDGKYDVVIAMYHDQGHIPIKIHNWEKSVSINLGLPFIRTSVDHGTACDIAGKGIANPQSMIEAIKIAINLAKNKNLPKT